MRSIMVRSNLYLFTLFVIYFATISAAQSANLSLSLGELNRLTQETDSKLDETKLEQLKNQIQIYQELEWIREVRSQVSRTRENSDNTETSQIEFSVQRIKDSTRNLRNELTQNRQEIVDEELLKSFLFANWKPVIDSVNSLFSPLTSLSGGFSDYQTFVAYDKFKSLMLTSVLARTDPFGRIVDISNSFTADADEVENILSFLETSFLDSTEELLIALDNLLLEEENERSSTINSLETLSQRLNEYETSMFGRLEEIVNRKSVVNNLSLYMVIIGAIGILTILVAKLYPPEILQVWIEGGQLIQFVTVTILLSAIMILGLSSILGENILGTLLGGIGGYVLSQGVGRAAAEDVARRVANSTRN